MQSKHYDNLIFILLEFELGINLSPKLTRDQILKIKEQINAIVNSLKL